MPTLTIMKAYSIYKIYVINSFQRFCYLFLILCADADMLTLTILYAHYTLKGQSTCADRDMPTLTILYVHYTLKLQSNGI